MVTLYIYIYIYSVYIYIHIGDMLKLSVWKCLLEYYERSLNCESFGSFILLSLEGWKDFELTGFPGKCFLYSY